MPTTFSRQLEPVDIIVALAFAILILFSAITLSLSAPYAAHLYTAPIILHHRWSKTHLIFYAGTLPVLSILAATLEILLIYLRRLNRYYCTLTHLLLAIGWIVQEVIWYLCDWNGARYRLPGRYETTQSFCLQTWIEKDAKGHRIDVADKLGDAKVTFGLFTTLLYVVSLGVCWAI